MKNKHSQFFILDGNTFMFAQKMWTVLFFVFQLHIVHLKGVIAKTMDDGNKRIIFAPPCFHLRLFSFVVPFLFPQHCDLVRKQRFPHVFSLNFSVCCCDKWMGSIDQWSIPIFALILIIICFLSYLSHSRSLFYLPNRYVMEINVDHVRNKMGNLMPQYGIWNMKYCRFFSYLLLFFSAIRFFYFASDSIYFDSVLYQLTTLFVFAFN